MSKNPDFSKIAFNPSSQKGMTMEEWAQGH